MNIVFRQDTVVGDKDLRVRIHEDTPGILASTQVLVDTEFLHLFRFKLPYNEPVIDFAALIIWLYHHAGVNLNPDKVEFRVYANPTGGDAAFPTTWSQAIAQIETAQGVSVEENYGLKFFDPFTPEQMSLFNLGPALQQAIDNTPWVPQSEVNIFMRMYEVDSVWIMPPEPPWAYDGKAWSFYSYSAAPDAEFEPYIWTVYDEGTPSPGDEDEHYEDTVDVQQELGGYSLTPRYEDVLSVDHEWTVNYVSRSTHLEHFIDVQQNVQAGIVEDKDVLNYCIVWHEYTTVRIRSIGLESELIVEQIYTVDSLHDPVYMDVINVEQEMTVIRPMNISLEHVIDVEHEYTQSRHDVFVESVVVPEQDISTELDRPSGPRDVIEVEQVITQPTIRKNRTLEDTLDVEQTFVAIKNNTQVYRMQ